ncbi:uncharacterized protein LOC118371498 [Oncorhynchus keta]|uniref:uncharacterized protein LOC118371498 n=1 Tax=Oncorhynchus keta TaxID=8018 RepID=UPI00227C63A8|nr:uncharacterized protein LOC118371498 [Oncorhynchus keta]
MPGVRLLLPLLLPNHSKPPSPQLSPRCFPFIHNPELHMIPTPPPSSPSLLSQFLSSSPLSFPIPPQPAETSQSQRVEQYQDYVQVALTYDPTVSVTNHPSSPQQEKPNQHTRPVTQPPTLSSSSLSIVSPSMHQHLQRKHIAPVPPTSTPQDLEIPQLPHMEAVQHHNQYSKYVPPDPLSHQNRPSPPSGPQHHHPSSPSHYSYMYHYTHSQPGSPSKHTSGSHPPLYQQYSVPDPTLHHYQKYVVPPAPSNPPNIQHHSPHTNSTNNSQILGSMPQLLPTSCHDFRRSWLPCLFGRCSAVVVTGLLAATIPFSFSVCFVLLVAPVSFVFA